MGRFLGASDQIGPVEPSDLNAQGFDRGMHRRRAVRRSRQFPRARAELGERLPEMGDFIGDHRARILTGNLVQDRQDPYLQNIPRLAGGFFQMLREQAQHLVATTGLGAAQIEFVDTLEDFVELLVGYGKLVSELGVGRGLPEQRR